MEINTFYTNTRQPVGIKDNVSNLPEWLGRRNECLHLQKQQNYKNPAQLLLLTKPTALHRMPCTASFSSGCQQHPRTEIMLCLKQIAESKNLSPRVMGFKPLILYYLRRPGLISQDSDSSTFPSDQPTPEGDRFEEQLTLENRSTPRLVNKIPQHWPSTTKRNPLYHLVKTSHYPIYRRYSNIIKVHIYAQCQEQEILPLLRHPDLQGNLKQKKKKT